MGWIRCVRFKNFDATSYHELLYQFGPFCTEFRKSTKRSEMHQNICLGSNGVDRVCSLRKTPTRHPGRNFGTSLPCFAPSFVRQPSGLECTQIVLNHQNISLGSNGVDRVRSLQKIPTRLRGTNFCTISAHFAPNFETQPNSPQCTKIVRNAPKLYERTKT